MAITLLPVLLALVHATGIYRFSFVDRLDQFIYDVRLRSTLPRTLDPRIVIVDIDDASLQQLGQWPWSRDKLAKLTTEIMVRQQAAVLGFDVIFAEPDGSSSLATLERLVAGPLRDVPGLADEVRRMAPELDHDAAFARAIAGQRVALGYYLTQRGAKGLLTDPVLPAEAFPADHAYTSQWSGFGGNIAPLASVAASAGFLNMLIASSEDGLVRSAPLLARYDGSGAKPGYYESLGMAVFRLAHDAPPLGASLTSHGALDALLLPVGAAAPLRVPVDQGGSTLVPFRGPGGAGGGSFRYVSAADVLNARLAPAELRGKIVLVGATAPGLEDLRATPIGSAFPGVEIHANVVSAMLDRRFFEQPAYAAGYDALLIVLAGLALVYGLSVLPVVRATLLGATVTLVLVGLNSWAYLQGALVLPLAAALVMTAMAIGLSMGWGYFVESRVRRSLTQLFGTYVPPQLVEEMLASPRRYSMRAQSKELTVMFCDMRGFTQMSEQMAPTELQAFLNSVFSRLTAIISAHRGTVDKYMGDCVMAFWGAPVDTPDHAELAVAAALEMAAAVHTINDAHRAGGRPEISVGIGLNTGVMSVGDMGSALRRSYTVVGDAVNLASRLEGLSGRYGVEVIASETTRRATPAFAWQELDRVLVKGKAQAVAVFEPLGLAAKVSPQQQSQLDIWQQVLNAYRAQDWATGRRLLAPLLAPGAKKVLYQLYDERLASMALRPKDLNWDGATRFETK
ncbi:MAG: adenylate/guanylate cyclase domain-containing protein [Variovorax sp.]|nr:MAG: adenylate/guanylate cyclase domain-containing protein [Variovorax sp.]